ncbi:MAG: ABC transporter permease [Planctomycetota bacterium]|nr:MAG: ABC transporter permease [Planctomycetota bacterium]
MKTRYEKWLLPLCVLAALLVLWSLWASGGSGGATDFPTPLEVVRGFADQFQTKPGERAPIIVRHVVSSLFRTSSGFLLAVALGVPIGLAMGWYSRVFYALNPLVQLLRPISAIAWIPIAIMIFNRDDPRSILLIFIASLFPIVVSSAAAVRSIPQVYIRAAENFGVSGWALFRKVVLPACLPQIVTALRVAFGIAWIVVVAAEMVAVQEGLGWLIIDARYQGARTDLIVGTMILIGLIGLTLDTLMRKLENLDQVRWGITRRD